MRATTRLYLITPPALDPDRFANELEEALAGGDVASLQLRLKDCDDEAIRRAAPTGVDVASGVESRPGVKDPELVRAFVAAVRAAEER